MKVRNGFVSNSSSSSFIIGVKGELTKEKLLDIFKVPNNSPIYFLADDFANLLIDASTKTTIKEIIYNFDLDSLPEDYLPEWLNNKEHLTFYSGTVHDDGDGIELAICSLEFNIDTDDLFFKKEARFF